MADNKTLLDGNNALFTARTTDKGGVNVPHSMLSFSYSDRSGTLAAGNTAQVMMTANASRQRLFVQNPLSATEDLWLCFTGTAVVGSTASIQLGPGDAWSEDGSGVTTQAVSVIALTTGHAWRALEA